MALFGTLMSGPSAMRIGTSMSRIYDHPLTALRANCSTESDSSGFASCTISTTGSESATVHPSPASSPESLHDQPARDDRASMNRRSSSGQKIAKLLNALTPCRGRVARRSHSFGDLTRTVRNTDGKFAPRHPVSRQVLTDAGTASLPFTPANQQMTLSNLDLKSCCDGLHARTQPSYSNQLDVSVTDPTVELYEFRRRWPASFAALTANYLGFLQFSADEMDQIRDALQREAKCTPAAALDSTEFGWDQQQQQQQPKRRLYTPQKPGRSRESKNYDKELEHWYIVVNTMLNYLLEDKRFKHRFILRRPGNHSSVNELERILFPPRHRPLSVSVRNRSGEQPDDRLHHPALVSEVLDVLRRYDPAVIACLLARVLRRNGLGLIPSYLRCLFLQLVNGVKENEVHQRRAVRLLFQLVPRRLLRSVIRPVFELLACVANEPECEVDESSLAVLFSPIFFLDRTTTTPASLANPLPIRVVHLFVCFAKREQQLHQSVARLFQVPSLFQEDCTRNLKLNMSFDNPPLSCSLKYCVTMTPSPQSQGKKADHHHHHQQPRCQVEETSQMKILSRPGMPKVNLTATFVAKRPRHRSPFLTAENTTPVLKNALLGPTLDFRVRRTPTHFARSQCLSVNRSPPNLSRSELFKWSS